MSTPTDDPAQYLGDLPEPDAWNVYWKGDNDSVSWDQWHDASDPLPAAWDDEAPNEITPYIRADNVRAYALDAVQRALAAQQQELQECEELREKLSDLLRRTAVALRGPEPPLTRWSWHDLPERAAAAIAAIDVMQRAAVALAQQEPGK
jgi:hypothetical protein